MLDNRYMGILYIDSWENIKSRTTNVGLNLVNKKNDYLYTPQDGA